MKIKIFNISMFFLTSMLFSGCISKATKSSTQNDIMIHQLRVELEEIKHHIHTTVMQMNILTNKMVNSEDTIFELKQRDLITQKQSLEINSERLDCLEKKVEIIVQNEDNIHFTFKQLEDEIAMHTRSLQQNKKKIHQIEKDSITFQENAQ